ncbi:MAG TPA: aspartate aminotransferase family protein [Patescibacteria group bacterium]|nr:aspartate aminotransferase family protein [Patescibacteria group bacterium]
MKNFLYLQQKYVVNTYVNRQLTLVKGSGVFLFDEKGEKYLDLMSNYGVSIFGYGHPAITHALVRQLQKLATLHGSFANDLRAEASEKLVKRCGLAYGQVYWSNSGAEAVEAALKFAVLATGKRKFIVCERGYHGKTLGALSATSGEKYKKPFEPLLWDFIRIPFNDPLALEKAIDSRTAGFIVEPIQGEGGVYVPDPDYLQRVRELCNDRKILLILDEIQTGTGRTGSFLASQRGQVSADILCLGKGLAGGIPIGTTLVREEIAALIPKHIHTSTFGGNPLACAGVLVTLDLLNEKNLEHVRNTGKYFKEQLSLLRSGFISGVRGEGLLLGLAIKEKRNHVLKLLQESRILAIPSGEDVIRFLPPYIIQKEEIDTAINALQKIVRGLS